MILVTVGTQLTFDRLVKSVEDWAIEANYTDIVFQVGQGSYVPKIGKVFEFLPANEMNSYFDKANIIIGHAGMGTILTCLTNQKPLVIMPRLFKFGEHRNDHQLATFNNTIGYSSIFAAENEKEVATCIEDALAFSNKDDSVAIANCADQSLINFIRSEIL